MGIVTMLSDTATGKNQNKEAQFFVWMESEPRLSPVFPSAAAKPSQSPRTKDRS